MALLDGKTAIITGSARGIGRATAERFAAEGAQVTINDIDGDVAEQAAGEISGETIAVSGDLTKPGACDEVVQKTVDAFGKVDILVNNAGVYEFSPLEEVTEEHFRRQFDLNVLGPLLTSQQAVKHFGAGGGSIINVSSIASTLTLANSSVYNATKAALDAVTRSLAKELGARNIRVNAINPGMVETEGLRAAGFDEGDLRKQAESRTPLGRIGQTRDIAPAAVFLASEEASWITGETLVVAGGLY
jgi:3-oxoacyl-[acyl-carrier protein] reductase